MILRRRLQRLGALVVSIALLGTVLINPMTAGAQAGGNPPAPYGLLTNELENPLNVEAPSFSWWNQDADLDDVQTAYQLVVKDDLTGKIVWDSGKVESSEQSNVAYAGPELQPAHPYNWTVTTWDEDGLTGTSEAANFATGLEDEDWSASWLQKPGTSLSVEPSGSAARVEGGGLTYYKEGVDWTNYAFSAEIRAEKGTAGAAFFVKDANNAYIWALEPGKGLTKTALVNGEAKALGTVEMSLVEGATYTVKITADGSTIKTSIDGTEVDTTTDNTFSSGSVGFYEAEGQVGEFQQVSVTSLDRQIDSIYIPGEKSADAQIILNDRGYEWGDYTLDFDMQINDTSNDATAVMLHSSSDFKTGYMWQFTRKKGGLARHTMTNGKFTKLDGNGAISYSFKANTYYHITIAIKGNTITTSVDGEVIDTFTDTNNVSSKGTFGFRHTDGEGGTYSNIKVTAEDGSMIFAEDFQNLEHYKLSNGQQATSIRANDNTKTYLAPNFSKGFEGWSNAGVMREADGSFWATCNTNGVTVAKTGTDWDNYTVTMRAKAKTGAAGIVFRAADSQNGYMWQLVPGTGLKVHKQVNGKFTALKDAVPCSIVANQTYRITVEVNGDTFKTYLNGNLIDTTTDSTYSQGTIGFRESTTGTEIGQFSEVSVTDTAGNTLFEDTFADGLGKWDGTAIPATGSNLYWYARTEQKLEEGKKPVRALAYIAAAHDYELSVNGVRFGRGQSFDYSSETHYQGWDVTEALDESGSIAVGILARWYGNGQGRAAGVQGLLGEIVVYYDDNTSQVVSTSQDWVAAEAPLSGSSKRNGEGDFIEEYDARKEIANWSAVGFDDSGWSPVYVLGEHPTDPFTNVQPELGHVTEEPVKPETITKLDDGTTIVDFGRVIPARLSIRFADGKAGQKLTVTTGYELKSDGKVNTSNSSSQSTKMTFIYTQKDGEQTYNTWDHLGFRYMQIPSVGQDFTLEDITAYILHAEVPEGRESTLSSSNDMLDQVYELMKYSSLYSVQNEFVDTPTREKGQFLQDGANTGAATTTAWYERTASKKAILQFLASADRYWKSGNDLGRYNAVYPNGDGKRDIPDYSLNMPIWVWNYYMQTGDLELLEYAYPYLQQTAEYATRAIPSEGATAGLVTQLEGGSGQYKYGIVDWPEPGRFGYDMNAVARTTINALSVRLFDTVSKIAQTIGREETEVNDYAVRAENLKNTMNEKLITADGVYCDGLLSDGTQSSHNGQHSTSYALAFGIAPQDKIDAMAEYVASLGMKQGPMTADILVQSLFDNGRADAALKLLTNTEDFGWAQLIDKYDATFIWEQWEYGQSQSHGWGAAALAEIQENILGVTVTGAGAESVTVNPAKDILDHAEGRVVTERGPVEVSYSGSGESYTLKVTVPTNVLATVVLPRVEGGQFVDQGGNSGTSTFTDDGQLVTVGGGTREFVFQKYAKANKTILNKVIEYAQAQKADEAFSNVIQDVQDSFNAALENAVAVAENKAASQQDVDKAWQTLMTEIHKLGFVRGDISSLETLVEAAEGYDLSKYVEAGQKEFTEALSAAKELVADKGNAMEQEIEQASGRLLDAMLKLRLKADKSVLLSVLAKAAELDTSLYTAESVETFNAANDKANSVNDNPDATQTEVNDAAEELQAAIDGLETAGQPAANTAVQGDKNMTTGAASAKTGDTAPIAAAAVLALACAAAVLFKKQSK